MNKKCVAALGSVTAAIKIEKLLSEHNIQSRIIKLNPEYTEKGCAYGVEFLSSRKGSVDRILSGRGIEYKILTL